MKPLSWMRHALFGLCLVGMLSAQEAKKQTPKKEARAAIVAAGKLARVPKGASKNARAQARARAVEAYAVIEKRYAGQALIVAQACFRRGQILGRMGQEQPALKAYRAALTANAEGMGARAMLEAGHLQRRLKRYTEALAFYRESAALSHPKGGKTAAGQRRSGTRGQSRKPTANQRYGAQAQLWIGVALVSLGRVPDARKCWSILAADTVKDTALRIKAFDRLALSYLTDKNEAEAKKVLADADKSLAGVCAGKSKKAQSLRRSLGRMRARKAIAKAESSRQKKRGEQGLR